MWNPRIIMSRIIKSDQRSPIISREIFTGQPDRRQISGLCGTFIGINYLGLLALYKSYQYTACITQVIAHRSRSGHDGARSQENQPERIPKEGP